jgi:excisionase family DNA binding protein
MTLLTVPEAAAELRISKRTVERLTARGDLEVVRIGGRVLIRPEAIEAYVKSRIEPAVTSIRRRRSA